MKLTSGLLKWYEKHQRDLPWRGTKDAYKVWVSEVILQQTRIEQGTDYFLRFMHAFPDVYALAGATEDEVLRMWQGLGYYSRARNMHHTARILVAHHNGAFPKSSKELVKLKGVGEYTAAAIASIVYDERVPAIDGNAYRVISRLFALPHNIDTSRGKKAFREIIQQIMPENRPGEFNQALMDLGSIICKPVNPLCNECFLNEQCLALQEKNTDRYPVRNPKTPSRKRFFNYFFFELDGPNEKAAFFIQKRTQNDIWKQMYELPLLESDFLLEEDMIFMNQWWQKLFPQGQGYLISHISSPYTHMLTHQRIDARLIKVKVVDGFEEELRKNFLLTDAEAFDNLAKPILIEKLLNRHKD